MVMQRCIAYISLRLASRDDSGDCARVRRMRGRLSSCRGRGGRRRRGDEEGWSSQRPASIRAVLATARYARGDVMAPRLRQQWGSASRNVRRASERGGKSLFAKKRQCHAVALTLSLPAGPVKPTSPRGAPSVPVSLHVHSPISLKSCPRARIRSTGSRFLRRSRRTRDHPLLIILYASEYSAVIVSTYCLCGRCEMRGARAEEMPVSHALVSLSVFIIFLLNIFLRFPCSFYLRPSHAYISSKSDLIYYNVV